MGADRIDPRFVAGTVLKRDVFSETVDGYFSDAPDEKLVLRRLEDVPGWARPIAQFLARREIRGLQAVQGIEGVPVLIDANRAGILRVWSAGTPLNLAKPATAEWYRDARRLLREMRRRGVTHNDIAKPQNWLMTPEGRAAVIDFQLASVHRRRGLVFRLMAREDLRHLVKQKGRYAPELLTPSERKILALKSLPTRVWLATGKRLYNFVTRRLMNWSDSEGAENRIALEGETLRAQLMGEGVREVVLMPFALPSKGVGVYAFVEGPVATPLPAPDLTQEVRALPRINGRVAEDLLSLVALNRMDELAQMLERHPDLADQMAPIVAGRLNLTDRQLRRG